MKRTATPATLVVLLTITPAPVRCFTIFTDLAPAVSEEVRPRPNATRLRTLGLADFAISKVDRGIVEAFTRAWRRSFNGVSVVEAVVLILPVSGGYAGRELGFSNEFMQFTFRWDARAIAIVHTHPNSSDPKPHGEDLVVADKYNVPVFTITSRGMYVYDPGSKKITRVMKNLDWLDPSKWNSKLLVKQ